MRERLLAAAMMAVVTTVGVVSAGTAAARPDDAAVRPGGCVVDMPERAECGVLEVPENRGSAGGRSIELPYVVVRAEHPEPDQTPLVFVNGGPGSGTVQLAGYLAEGMALARNRDVVLLEQRGGSRSTPTLECPEASAELADAFTRTEDPSIEAEPVAASMRACLDAFIASEGDPAGYTVGESAADLRDLREALGYERWALYGLSWSTQVMAEAALIDPDGVAAVVLDSFSVPGQDFADGAYTGLRDSLASLGARSGGDFPDPYEDLLTAAARLDERPQAFAGHNPVTGEPRTYQLTGDDLVTFVHAALYDVELLPIVPYMLSRLADGHTGVLGTLVDVGVDELTSHNLGQYWVMQCQDEVPFRTAGASRSSPLIEWLAADEVVCDALGLEPSPARELTTFGQPTLVLAGVEDPVTPATLSERAARDLPDHQVVSFAGVGHAVMLQSRCARIMIAGWLDEPSRDVTSLCDPSQVAYPVLGEVDIHPTTLLARAALTGADGNWLVLAPVGAFAVMCLAWTVAWGGGLVTSALRRRPVGSRIALGLPPLIGTVFLLAAGGAVWMAYDRLATEIVLGVPRVVPWFGLLLVAGGAALVPGWRRAGSRVRIGLVGAAVIWFVFAVWYTVVIVLPS